jgi:hypothetical protein
MAYSEAYSGSATISTTEYSLTNNSTTLAAQTTDAQIDIVIDFSAMTATEQYEIAIYEKVRAADSQMLAFPKATLTGAQPSAFVFLSPTLLHGWDVSVKKVTGTDRTIKWSIRSIT